MPPSGTSENIRVCARFRPRNEKEKNQSKEKQLQYEVTGGNTSVTFHGVGPNITQSNSGKGRTDKISFNLDRIYKEESTQDEVFEWIANNIVKHCFEGYNGTIFAYGQTSSGKTHTMFGPDNYLDSPDDWGIVLKSVSELFNFVHTCPAGWEFAISTSYYQLYKETIQDLLKPTNNNLKIHESKARGIFVEGLSSEYLEDVPNLLDVLTVGSANKKVASTEMNARSSRGHSILQVTLVQRNEEGSSKTGKFTFVDLAGSERVDKTHAVGQTFEEAKKINLSLTCLANVIKSLSVGTKHIPYRDSKLTRILQESLGGNTKTMLILCCSPDLSNIEETLSTLRFGKSAKTIKNQVKVNVRRSAQELEYMLKRLQEELAVERKQVETLKAEIEWMKSPDYNPDGGKPEGMGESEEGEEAAEVFDIEDRMAMEQELEGKQVKLDSLQEELASLQAEHAAGVEAAREQREALEQAQASLKKLEAAAKVDARKIEQLVFDAESSGADKTVLENQVDAWKQKLDSSQATKDRVQQAADKLKEEIKSLEEEKAALANKILEAEKESIALQQRASSAEEESAQAAQACDKLKADLKGMEEKLSESETKGTAASSQLREKLRDLQASFDESDERTKSLESQLGDLRTSLEQKREESDAFKSMHEAFKAKAEADAKEQGGVVEGLESKLKESQKGQEDLGKDLKDKALQLSQAEKDLQRAKKSLEETKASLQGAAADFEAAKGEMEAALQKEKEMSSSLETELLNLRKSLHRHKNTISREAPEVAAGDSGSVEQVEALFKTIDKYKKITQEYTEKNKKVEEGASELRKEVASLRGEKKALEEQAEVAKEDHAKALAELEDEMNGKIGEEKSRTMDLRTKLMEKRSVLMKLTSEKKSAEKAFGGASSELKALREDMDKKVEEVRELEGKIRHLNHVVARIHADKEDAHEQHQDKVAKLEAEKAQLGTEIERLEEQKQEVVAQVAEKVQEISTHKMSVLKEKALQEKIRSEKQQVADELEGSKAAMAEMERQVEDTIASSKREVEAHAASLETSKSMIQKQADHISELESELKDRDEQIVELEQQQQEHQEQQQEHQQELDVLQEKYDTLVAEMPMRVRAKIYKPVLGGVEKALKEKIDLGGVRKQLRRVGRKSMADGSKPPPPPPKEEDAGAATT